MPNQRQDKPPLSDLGQFYSDPRIRAAAKSALKALLKSTTPETQAAVAEFVIGAAAVSKQVVVELRRVAVGMGIVAQEEAEGLGIGPLLKLMSAPRTKKRSRSGRRAT